MKDAAYDLLAAVRSALIAHPGVAGLVGEKVLSSWGDSTAAPLLRIQVPDAIKFEADTGDGEADGAESTVNVHCFTKEPAPLVCSILAGHVRAALDAASLALATTDLWHITYTGTRYRQDTADPDLRMAIVSFTAVTTD